MTTERIKLAAIRTDGGTQTRAKTDEDAVARYASAMVDGAKLPPVVVFFDGSIYWLADGFHRCAASKAADFLDVDADVHQGTCDDAVLYSCGANESDAHRTAALPRTHADKRRAVERALRLFANRGVRKGDGEIAEICKVSRKLVQEVRSQLVTGDKLVLPTKVDSRDGKTRETANTGKSSKRATMVAIPSAPLATAMTGEPPRALMPTTNLFAPPAEAPSSVVPIANAPAEWDENDFLCDVRSQLDDWRTEWLRHRASTSTLTKELRLYLNVMEKEDARNRASNG